jgi:hypothetical protein
MICIGNVLYTGLKTYLDLNSRVIRIIFPLNLSRVTLRGGNVIKCGIKNMWGGIEDRTREIWSLSNEVSNP